MYNYFKIILILCTLICASTQTDSETNEVDVESLDDTKPKLSEPLHRGVSQHDTSSNLHRGIDFMINGSLNKDLAFSIKERIQHKIIGLLPPAVQSMQIQIDRTLDNLAARKNDLQKYVYFLSIRDTNEKLFYHLLTYSLKDLMPLVYSPVVEIACQQYSLIYRRPRGLFISINDKEHISDVLKNWPERAIRVIVVTDGERVRGLGDLGANAMGKAVGKSSLYTAIAGIKPEHCLPITLDVGTDLRRLNSDPFYIGLKQERVSGEKYNEFMDKFMKAVEGKYGPYTLIQFEDFSKKNSFELLEKYRKDYCMFNDDIQGTATVLLAGILARLRFKDGKNSSRLLSDQTILFRGNGKVSLNIAALFEKARKEEGILETESKGKIYHFGSGSTGSLIDSVTFVKPNIFIEVDDPEDVVNWNGTIDVITRTKMQSILVEMRKYSEHPIIFALRKSSKDEKITEDDLLHYSGGKAIYSTGSSFSPVQFKGNTFYPGPTDNAYIFPGVALGVIYAGVREISDEILIVAAKTLAKQLKQEDFDKGSMYPPIKDIRKCSLEIAVRIMEYAQETGIASVYSDFEGKEKKFLMDQKYYPEYTESIPKACEYPKYPES